MNLCINPIPSYIDSIKKLHLPFIISPSGETGMRQTKNNRCNYLLYFI